MNDETKHPLKVFLCHASGDKPPVLDLYKQLTAEGVDAWLDQEKLLPGQSWRLEIPRAVHEADVVVICLSKNSVTKEGYVQKEIKFALDSAEEKPEGTIFLIPARLEDCMVPERLSSWQWVDLYEENGFIKLLRSLKLRANTVGATIEPTPYQDSDKELGQRIKQLYTEGLAAFYTEDWDKACHRFQSILSEQPNHKNASEKLAEAEQQRTLSKLYDQALEAIRAEDWQAAISIFEKLSQTSANYKDVPQLLGNARKQKQLRELYAEAETLHTGQKWQAVVRVFEQISAIEPNYPDPNGLLASAQNEVVELKRIADLNELYGNAVGEMEAGNWLEARRLLEQIHKTETGFLETERLLRKVENEITKLEEQNRRKVEVDVLYEQAHGLLRSKKWREALDKIEEIEKLENDFEDKDGIAQKARVELEREEKDTQKQNQLAALYAEAVRLLKEEKYQDALDKWQEVRAIDAKYPDRQGVERTIKRKLVEQNKTVRRRIRLPQIQRKYLWVISISILILLCLIGGLIYINLPPIFPEYIYVTSIKDPLFMASKASTSIVFVDGKITYPGEWKDSGCYQLYLVKHEDGQGCSGGYSVTSTWFIKNDSKRLYTLIRIPKTSYTPVGVGFGYYYPYPYEAGWQKSDTMSIDQGKPLDQFGWNDINWRDDVSDGGSMDTRAKMTDADQYYWFEFSKLLNSGDGHDWNWKSGDKVGTDVTGGLMIGSWGNPPMGATADYVCRNIQLQLAK